jgi:signal peptidase I
MMDTLQDNQQLAVNRLGETYAKINRSDYIPKRGSVAIINKPQDGAVVEVVEDNSLVVKRIVGIPGDTVKMTNGVISVYYVEKERPESLLETEQPWYESVLEGTFDTDLEITLGVGELFVVGDNRDNSIDSRFYGPVKADQILGEVIKGL